MHYNRQRRTGSVGPAQRLKAEWGTGYVDPTTGYRMIHRPGHPLARAQGSVGEHRIVLYAAIGPGEHPCHWCARPLTWVGSPDARICADHLDGNRTNNIPSNLVPACLDCNTKRAAA